MLEMAFIGLGQGGGRIADQFAALANEKGISQYTAMAINTATNDLQALKHIPLGQRLSLESNQYGAGRTPDIAKKALEAHAYEIGERSREITKDAEYIWLIAGLGGGTGTGCLDFMLDYVDDLFDAPVGLIITLPHSDDGHLQKINAVNALAKIHAGISEQRLRSVLIVNNNHFYQNLVQAKNKNIDWRDQSNQLLVEHLHELNQLTESAGDSNFDRMDLLNFLSYSGCLAIGTADIQNQDTLAVVQTVRNALSNDAFSRGYLLEETKAFATLFTAPSGAPVRSAKTEQQVLTELKSIAPNSLDSYWGSYEGEQPKLLCVAAGLGFPKYADELVDQVKNKQINRDIRAFDAPTADANELHNLLRPKPKPVNEAKSNPFRKRSDATDNEAGISNPFRKKR